jgi:hypothetical protein
MCLLKSQKLRRLRPRIQHLHLLRKLLLIHPKSLLPMHPRPTRLLLIPHHPKLPPLMILRRLSKRVRLLSPPPKTLLPQKPKQRLLPLKKVHLQTIHHLLQKTSLLRKLPQRQR